MSWTDINFNEPNEDSSSDFSEGIKSEELEDYDLCEDVNISYKTLNGQEYHFSLMFDEQLIKDLYLYECQNEKKMKKFYNKILEDNNIELGGTWHESTSGESDDIIIVSVDFENNKLVTY